MKIFKISIIIIAFTACKSDESKFEITNAYKSKINAFFNHKMKERKDDYLQLVALYKLDNGNNTFGKDPNNNLQLQIDALPATIGTIAMQGDSLSFSANENIEVKTKNDSIITRMPLKLNLYESSIMLYHNQLRWQIITRSKQHYLRVWDSKNPAIETFKGFQHFELNNTFIFDADFTYYETEKTEIVEAKVDGKRSTNFIGQVTFTYKNKPYALEVGSDGFTMVGDATSGDTTYGGGRYMYIDVPKKDGKTVLDFNKLYNPPCAFSEFTTCLYPPRQNQLPFAVLAGEKISKNN